MKAVYRFLLVIVVVPLSVTFLSSFYDHTKVEKYSINFPYKKAGFTEREAAAYLLSRFTFGAEPSQVDEVVKTGLEKWFTQQLNGELPDDTLKALLSSFDAIKMSNAEVVNNFPRGPQVRRMAIKDGIIDKDSVNAGDKKEYRDQLQSYMQQKGFRPQQELFRQLINQKILRAAYSNNQLQEVLTDFWLNHFNVSITKNDCAEFIMAYERDAIRPNVFGKFQDLLISTAKSPAMLLFLDNFSSSGTNTSSNLQSNGQLRKIAAARMQNQMNDTLKKVFNKLQQAKKNQGLNENYAREVMELHTLGVDGGYTQQDVTQAARVLTGWTVFPISDYGPGAAIRKMIDNVGEDNLVKRGFVHEGDFLFAVNRHDNDEKTVLGKTFPANKGYEEGVELLNMLAHHPSTAKFISRKLAVRFVSDNPPQSLIDKMAKTFTDKDGDLKQVLITMASSPEFWNKEAARAKTKSPFELVISSVRAVNAEVKQPYQLFNWMDKMGQKIYFYQAPTGFPDRSQYWINTGALLNRMNFGLAFASERIPGIKINLLAINHGHEPESSEAALVTYSKLVMPERNLDETVTRLKPLLNDPELVKKVDEAAGKTAPIVDKNSMTNEDAMMSAMDEKPKKGLGGKKGLNNNSFASLQSAPGNNSMLTQVVGIILGSPEFQRK